MMTTLLVTTLIVVMKMMILACLVELHLPILNYTIEELVVKVITLVMIMGTEAMPWPW